MTDEKIRWGTEQRLEFIELVAIWEGKVNRRQISRRFGVSTPQASADFARYQELAPDNLEYDASAKGYLATSNFQPRFASPEADRYLGELKGVAEGYIAPDRSWISSAPDVALMPVPYRRVDAKILQTLIAAIRTRSSVEAHYHSMNAARPEPQWRRITPHALGHDSLRWHIRAYCHVESRFKDFVLSRFLKVADFGEPGAAPSEDGAWNTYFEIILKPNPRLSKAQQKTVERDYDMRDGHLAMRVRCAFLYYINKRLRLDVADENDTPKETPVIVANRSQFEAELDKYS